LRIDFERLFLSTSGLVGLSGVSDAATGQGFVDLLGALVGFDYCVVFAYRGNERPIDLFSTFDREEYQVFVALYQQGPYLLDPFYSAATAPKPGIWRMRELAPDRFFASEYYRNYYVQTGLSEEIGFFVPVRNGVTVVLSLMRSERAGAFRPAEYDLLRKVTPLVRSLVESRWSHVADHFDARLVHEPYAPNSATARPWSNQNLTEREKSIIELVLQGHSSESIGLRLGVATGTVKVHRRNIYRKLGISSQMQLMSLYLDGLRK
jgi:DNA-binding CsgD family transcriptional regulator